MLLILRRKALGRARVNCFNRALTPVDSVHAAAEGDLPLGLNSMLPQLTRASSLNIKGGLT